MRKEFKPGSRLSLPGDAPDIVIALTPAREVLLASRAGEPPRLPSFSEFPLHGVNYLGVGCLDGLVCGAVELPSDFPVPENLRAASLRLTLYDASAPARTALGRAAELLFFDRRRSYCGRCGHATENAPGDSARVCPACGEVFFPQLAPAVIVLITRGREVLLAHNAKFKPEIYGLIAGFVESGERLEDAVEREIMEEVSIRVKNVRYWGSQAWPFPNSLMTAFTAEYASGELHCDGVELVDGGWFDIEKLPPLPPVGAIGFAMIRDFAASLNCKISGMR